VICRPLVAELGCKGLFLPPGAQREERDGDEDDHGEPGAVEQASGKLGLSVTLGANVAATQPSSPWTDKSIGATIFINWMNDKARCASTRQGADRAYIGGPWAE